jgi:hypothetical protein
MPIVKKLLLCVCSVVRHLVIFIGLLSVCAISIVAISLIDPRFSRAELAYSDLTPSLENRQFDGLSIPGHRILHDRFCRRILVLVTLREEKSDIVREERYVVLPDSYTEQMHNQMVGRFSSDYLLRTRTGYVTATHVAIGLLCFAIAMSRKFLPRSVRRIRNASTSLLGFALCSMFFAAGLFFGSL